MYSKEKAMTALFYLRSQLREASGLKKPDVELKSSGESGVMKNIEQVCSFRPCWDDILRF